MNTTTDLPLGKISETQYRCRCEKCGHHILLRFHRADGTKMTREEARGSCAALDTTPMECPGYHVELSGWSQLWHFEEALAALYPAEDFTSCSPP